MKTRYFLGLAIGLLSLWMVRFFKPDMHQGWQLFIAIIFIAFLSIPIDWILKRMNKW